MLRKDDDRLSDYARLTLLEEAAVFQRKLLIGVLILAAITTSIAIALGVVRMVRPPSSYIETEHFVALKKEVDKVVNTNKRWQQKVDELSLELENSQAGTFKTLMLEQEQNYQLHLTALKNGMKDIAHMVPGSRMWLDIYNEQMDSALAHSKARMRKLASMQTGGNGAVNTNTLPEPEVPPLVEPN